MAINFSRFIALALSAQRLHDFETTRRLNVSAFARSSPTRLISHGSLLQNHRSFVRCVCGKCWVLSRCEFDRTNGWEKGKDKHENEMLLQHGWESDVWFHVDKLSSAHVYLRLKDGVTIDTIPENVLQDCIQLVKHNSIEGNKLNNVGIVYTLWSNLKKTGDMDVRFLLSSVL